MSNEQAGTPAATPEVRTDGAGTPAAPSGDGSGLNAQQQKEWMTLKQKAEEFNKVEAEKKALEARLAEMERLSVSRGAGQATDPMAELRATLQAQAEYDPASKAALIAMAQNERIAAEMWLTNELQAVPESKRSQVGALIRASSYGMSAKDALSIVTDPETSGTKSRVLELEAENARLKELAKQANGSSPAFAIPASAASDNRDNMPWSEAQSLLKRGGPAARELRDKMDGGKVKIDYRA